MCDKTAPNKYQRIGGVDADPEVGSGCVVVGDVWIGGPCKSVKMCMPEDQPLQDHDDR